MQLKLFVLIRQDMPIADQAVQAGHAVAEWCKRWQYHGNQDWNNETLVYLSVKNIEWLHAWRDKVRSKYYNEHSVFREPDMEMSMTAVACWCDGKIFSKLPLWDGNQVMSKAGA